MQIVIGPQCSYCQLVRIGQEDLEEPDAWLCGPFPDGIPRPYDDGNQDCPYRRPQDGDHYSQSGVQGRIRSKALLGQ